MTTLWRMDFRGERTGRPVSRPSKSVRGDVVLDWGGGSEGRKYGWIWDIFILEAELQDFLVDWMGGFLA